MIYQFVGAKQRTGRAQNMAKNIVKQPQAKFKTLKSVNVLVRNFGLSRKHDKIWRAERWLCDVSAQIRVSQAESRLWNIVHDLEVWSRSHRRLHGRPAIIDEFLIEHNVEIRTALIGLREAMEKLDHPMFYRDPQSPMMANAFKQAREALRALWALDLLEDETHEQEIARIAEPEPETPTEESPLTKSIRSLLDEYCPWGYIAPKPEKPKAQRVDPAPLDAAELLADIEAMLSE